MAVRELLRAFSKIEKDIEQLSENEKSNLSETLKECYGKATCYKIEAESYDEDEVACNGKMNWYIYEKNHSYPLIHDWLAEHQASYEYLVKNIKSSLDLNIFPDYKIKLEKILAHIELENARVANEIEVKERMLHMYHLMHEKLNETRLSIMQEMQGVNINIDDKLEDAIKTIDEKISIVKEDVEKSKNSIYPTLISVLGIFSSITFGMFGGLTLLSNVFSRIADASKKENVFLMLIAGLFIFIALFCLLTLLLSTIGNIIDKDNVLPKVSFFGKIFGSFAKWSIGISIVAIFGLIWWYMHTINENIVCENNRLIVSQSNGSQELNADTCQVSMVAEDAPIAINQEEQI